MNRSQLDANLNPFKVHGQHWAMAQWRARSTLYAPEFIANSPMMRPSLEPITVLDRYRGLGVPIRVDQNGERYILARDIR